MTDAKKIVFGVLAWTGAVSALHLHFNVDWAALLNERLPEHRRKINVAYIPVT